jgi:hypothetical protein
MDATVFLVPAMGGILHHVDLFEDHVPFALDFLGGKGGISDHVRKQVERDRQVLVEDLGVVPDEFLLGKGIELSPDRIDRFGDLGRGARLGPLEEQVLDEVGYPGFSGLFETGTALYPDAERCGAEVGHGFGRDRKAVTQYFFLYIHTVSSLILIMH